MKINLPQSKIKPKSNKANFMKTAAKMLNTGGNPSLRAYLHGRMSNFSKPRSLLRIHASELTRQDPSYCPRETAINLIESSNKPDQYISTCLQYTFDLGEALHNLLRDTWAKDIVYGDWVCVNCNQLHELTTRPRECKSCHKRSFKYDEVRFKSIICGASGGIDLLIKLPSVDKLIIVEAKSIKNEDWKNLKSPLHEHSLRTNLYMRLVEESDSPIKEYVDTQKSLVFYMSKGYGGKDESLKNNGIVESMTPFKEFWVKRDDAKTDDIVNKSFSTKQFIEEGIIPCGICATPLSPRAKKCSKSKQCFSGKYNHGDVHKLDIEILK